MLVSNLYKKVDVTWSTYSKMYNSKLVPIMDFCFSVWGFKPDTIHNRIIKFFLGVNKYTSTPVIHGDVGWDSPLIRRKVNMLGLWKRMDNKADILWDYSNCKTNWSHEVKQLFAEIGNIVAFQSCSLVNFENPRHFLQEVKLTLLDKYKHRWKNDIDSQSKLSLLYIHIKR